MEDQMKKLLALITLFLLLVGFASPVMSLQYQGPNQNPDEVNRNGHGFDDEETD